MFFLTNFMLSHSQQSLYEEPLPATLALPSRGLGWVGKVYQCTSVPAISINTPARAHTVCFRKVLVRWYTGTLSCFTNRHILSRVFRGSFAGLSQVSRRSPAGLPQVVPPSLVRRRWGFKEGAVSRPHQYKTQGKACLMCARDP